MGDTLLNFIAIHLYIYVFVYIIYTYIQTLSESCTEMEKGVLQNKLLKMQVTCNKDLRETDAKICIQMKVLLKNSYFFSRLLEHTFVKCNVRGHKLDEFLFPNRTFDET